MCLLHFHSQRVSSWLRSKLLAKTTCVKESVCFRATNPVHSALAAWVALLATMPALCAEDSQRLKAGSCGFTNVAVHGICRNPEPRGVTNMPWAALRCGVLGEDWGKHAWDNLLVACCRLQLDLILPGVAGDFSSLDWSRWATKNEQVASLWFVLTHSQGIAPLSEEHALQFTPHSPRFFYMSVGSTFGFSVSERCVLAIGQKAAPCQKGMIQASVANSKRDVVNCWGCYKPVGRLPQQMRLACLELRQVWLVYRVLRQVNQFYLAPVSARTKVPARLFYQMCWNACLWQHCQVCYAAL